MTRAFFLLLAGVAAFAADDPWTKVKELKSGTEVRVYRASLPTPIEGKLDEVTDEHIVVVVKNEQKGIPKDTVLRVEARPKSGGRIVETKTKDNPPDTTPPVGMSHGPNVPGQSTSTNVTLGKPAYETVYRRPAAHGKQ